MSKLSWPLGFVFDVESMAFSIFSRNQLKLFAVNVRRMVFEIFLFAVKFDLKLFVLCFNPVNSTSN